MSSSPTVRHLTPQDLKAAVQLSAEAGWNQTEQDWRLLLDLTPSGCLAIEVDGELVSTATLVCYGIRLAWVGMVLTKTAFRGRGYAHRLLQESLALADRMGIETVKLDATEQGRPLYEKLGFRAEQPVERWELVSPDRSSKITRIDASPLSADLLSEDLRAFGADRSELLKRLSIANHPRVLDRSYLMTREGRLRNAVAPCVADTAKAARALIQDAIQAPASGWFWDLLPANNNAVAIATELGFISRRRLLRMVRGKELRGEERLIYALAGFEFG